MDSSSDDDDVRFIGAPAGPVHHHHDVMPDLCGPDSSETDSAEVVRPPRGRSPVRSKRRRIRPRRELQTSGAWWALVVSEERPGERKMFALVKIGWDLRRPVPEGDINDCGACVYSAEQVCLFDDDVDVAPDFDMQSPFAVARALTLANAASLRGGGSVASRLTEEMAQRTHLLACSVSEAAMLREAAGGGAREFRSMRIRKRGAPVGILFDTPSKTTLKRWRAEVKPHVSQAGDVLGDAPIRLEVAGPDPLLFLPEGGRDESAMGSLPHRSFTHVRGAGRGATEVDPIRLVHAVSVCQHLRATKLFVEAVDDAYDYIFLEDDEAPVRNKANDPTRTGLQAAMARVDVVAMLLSRRQFRQWRQAGVVRSINVYSDASPVTGTELQGMLVDVNFTDGSSLRMTLPGSSLAYGHTDTMNKSVALIWACWLIAGPTVDDLSWFCSNIRSLTTDFGNEIHLLEAPDILAAVVGWIGGVELRFLRERINHQGRAFSRALRIAGWSHMLGNIMKSTANRMDSWPQYLRYLRELCKFFRNDSYRQHIRRRLRHLPAHLKALLTKAFTAGFAKWRYETVAEALKQIGDLREVCEALRPELFAHAQDQAHIASVMEACSDKKFLSWVVVAGNEIFQVLERLRRWGMICDCPAHQEQRARIGTGKHIECNRICLLILMCFLKSCDLTDFKPILKVL